MAEWRIDAEGLEALALGAGVLGTGGGGNVYVAKLWIRELLARGSVIRVVAPDALADDALVVGAGGIGAPTVSFEKLRRGDEETRAVRALAEHLGRRFDAIVPVEAGGANSMRPMAVAALTGLPLVDADGMGRAFPELQMTTFHIYGVPATPASIADETGAVQIWDGPMAAADLEHVARQRCIEMGGSAGMAGPVLTGVQLRRTAIAGTLSLARRVGAAVLEARARKTDPVAAILAAAAGGRVLHVGKIVDVERRTAAGFARGRARIAALGGDAGELVVEFQNENLVAIAGGAVVASVPDLISIVQTEDAEPIGTELLRYGQRVTVIVLPAPALLTTTEALAVVGPRAFGYEVDWSPTG